MESDRFSLNACFTVGSGLRSGRDCDVTILRLRRPVRPKRQCPAGESLLDKSESEREPDSYLPDERGGSLKSHKHDADTRTAPCGAGWRRAGDGGPAGVRPRPELSESIQPGDDDQLQPSRESGCFPQSI